MKYNNILELWKKYIEIRKKIRKSPICRSNALLEGEFSEYITAELFNAKRLSISYPNYDCKDKNGMTYSVKIFLKGDENSNPIKLHRINFNKVNYLVIFLFDPKNYKIIDILKIPRKVLKRGPKLFQKNIDPRKRKWKEFAINIKQLKKSKSQNLYFLLEKYGVKYQDSSGLC